MIIYFSPSIIRRQREWRLQSQLPRDEFVLLFPALLIFLVVSSKTGFGEHMRYVQPTARIYLSAFDKLLGYCLPPPQKKAYDAITRRTPSFKTQAGYVPFLSGTFVASSIFLLISRLWFYRHGLSYFNESVGGPLNGPKHRRGSNVDWGQIIRYLRSWTQYCNFEKQLLLQYEGRRFPANFERTEIDPFYLSNVNRLLRYRSTSRESIEGFAYENVGPVMQAFTITCAVVGVIHKVPHEKCVIGR